MNSAKIEELGAAPHSISRLDTRRAGVWIYIQTPLPSPSARNASFTPDSSAIAAHSPALTFSLARKLCTMLDEPPSLV